MRLRAILATVVVVTSALVLGGGNPAAAGYVGPPYFVLADFGYDQAWRVEKHVRFVTDITGDRLADIVGFGDAGVWTAIARGDGTFTTPHYALAQFGYAQGWRVSHPVHQRFVADITGDGRADIVGVFSDGVYTAIGNGDGTFGRFVRATQAESIRRGTYFVEDINGDGAADLFRLDGTGVWVALSQRNGFFFASVQASDDFTSAAGYAYVRPVDITGDGYPELVGWHYTAVPHRPVEVAHLQTETGYGPALPTSAFGHYDALADVTGDGGADLVRFTLGPGTQVAPAVSGVFGGYIPASYFFGPDTQCCDLGLVADITGDGRADMVGFRAIGTYTAVSVGDGTFGEPYFAVGDYGTFQGWGYQYPRFVADITADGCGDLVGFGYEGVWVAISRCDGGFVIVT